MTRAFLIPYALAIPETESVLPIEPVILARLRSTAPASPLHLSLVEIVRRRYIAVRKEVDRKDKEAIRAGPTPVTPLVHRYGLGQHPLNPFDP